MLSSTWCGESRLGRLDFRILDQIVRTVWQRILGMPTNSELRKEIEIWRLKLNENRCASARKML